MLTYVSWRVWCRPDTLLQLSTSAPTCIGALERAGVGADDVQEVYMGNVLSANLGQVLHCCGPGITPVLAAVSPAEGMHADCPPQGGGAGAA